VSYFQHCRVLYRMLTALSRRPREAIALLTRSRLTRPLMNSRTWKPRL
jgi:hypothetical protein